MTIGQDIYFHPGQYQPETAKGRDLVAHELAHTLQTRTTEEETLAPRHQQTASRDTLERNADALASGHTSQIVAAPAHTPLCSPFDGESEADQGRHRQLIDSISLAQANLLRLLSTRGLVRRVEVEAERSGAAGVVVPPNTLGTADETFQTYAERDARLRRIIRNLMAMGRRYRTTALPSMLPPATEAEDGSFGTTIETGGGNTASYSGLTSAWPELQAAYELYRMEIGETGEEFALDWYYLDPAPVIDTGAARGARRMGRGVPSGAYMVVPDIENDPLRYWRLTGFDPIPRGSVIVEFWHDDFGYYYTHRDQRIDVPSPWSR